MGAVVPPQAWQRGQWPGLVTLPWSLPDGADAAVELADPASQILVVPGHEPDLVLADSALFGDEDPARAAHQPARDHVVGRDRGGEPDDALGTGAIGKQLQKLRAEPA